MQDTITIPTIIPAIENHLAAPSFAISITANIKKADINQYNTSSTATKKPLCLTSLLNTVSTRYTAPSIAPQHRHHRRNRNSCAINSLKRQHLSPLTSI